MLQLQLNKHLQRLSSRSCFLIRLFFFSLSVHGILLLLLFFCVERNKRIDLSRQSPSQASIVLLPLIKHTASGRSSSGSKTVARIEKKEDHTTHIGSSTTTNTAIGHKKAASKPKTVALKKTEKKVPQTAQKKSIKPKKEPVKKSSHKEKVPEKKVHEEKKEANKNVLNSQAQMPHPANPLDTPQAIPDTQAGETLVIGWQDLQELQLINQIKDEIVQVWKRPAGLPSALIYKARIYIDHQGKQEIKHEDQTSSLALNCMARNFIKNFEFPRSVWGYEIELLL